MSPKHERLMGTGSQGAHSCAQVCGPFVACFVSSARPPLSHLFNTLSRVLPPVRLSSEATGNHTKARPQESPCDVGVGQNEDGIWGRLPRGSDFEGEGQGEVGSVKRGGGRVIQAV